MNGKIVAIVAAIGSVAALGLWRMNTPGNYDECIQKNLGSVHSDNAAKLLHASCAKQFPRTYSEQEVFGAK